MNKSFIILILIFFLPSIISGQNLHFRNHPIQNEIQDIQAIKLLETQSGFIWVGTNQGLFRFDGLDFSPIVSQDSLTTNKITALFEDSNHQIWIGYENGSIRILPNGRQIKIWDIEEGLPKVPITGFEEDDQGRLWIATYGEGLYCYQNNHLYNFDIDDGLLGNDLYCLSKSPTGKIWIGTDRGINLCTLQEEEKKVIESITKRDGLPDDIIRALLFDENGNCWVGTYDGGLAQINQELQIATIPYPSSYLKDPINSFALFKDKELWIGQESKGIIRYDLRNRSFQKVNLESTLEWDKIHDLLKDQEGNIWVLSKQYGIHSANRQFEYLIPQINNVQALLEDHDQQLWVGNEKGIYRYDSVFSTYIREFPDLNLNIISLYEDKFNNIWMGTFGQGIYCFNKKNKSLRHITESDGLSNGSVLSIDGINGHIWMATLGGISELKYDKNIFDIQRLDFKNYSTNSNLGTNFIYKVYIDSKERTWFCTDGKGISVWENGKITNFSHANNTPLKAVYSITEDANGHIWFSTAKHGIYKFDDFNFIHLTLKEGIRDLEISSLITDENGQIILVHPSGIDILDPSSNHLIYYDDEVKVNDIEPNLNAVCKGSNGVIWIGVQDRIIKYTALKEKLSIHPRTQLVNLTAFLDPLPFKEKNRFEYNQNSLVFDYIGLWYTDPLSVKYRYKLENFDPEWIDSRDRKATYSKLPPGKYTFKITSTENEAFAKEPIIEYDFEIIPPIWKRWWFIFIISCFILALGYYLLKTREKRLEKEASLKKEMIESQFEALKSQINPHFLFNTFNTLITIIEEDADTAVQFVEHLSDFYRSILQYRKHDLIPISEELKLVNDYSFLLKNRFGDNLQLSINVESVEEIQIVPLTLQMLIENAIKHNVISKDKPLKIKIQHITNDFIIVSNNLQPKLVPSPSTGFGLQNITSRYALLTQKAVKIEQSNHTFTVKIPLIKHKSYENINY